MSQTIHLSPPHLTEESHALLAEAMESNWIAPVGPMLKQWEGEIERVTGAFPVLTTSGEAALELALRTVGVQAGTTVITATHTCNATVNAILHLNAKPVFVDSDPAHWNMSINHLQSAVESEQAKGETVSAILFVHIYGVSNGLAEVQKVAHNYGISVVEDAAEAAGSRSESGKYLGCVADAGVWSFNGNKIITSGGGGVLLCRNREQQQRALKWATQAKEDAPWYEHKEVGHTYRMSNLLAAVGLGQWRALELRVSQRRAIHERYRSLFGRLGIAEKMRTQDEGTDTSNRWLSAFVMDDSFSPDSLIAHLKAADIEARRFWKPMHLQAVYVDSPYYGEAMAEGLFNAGICLPSGTGMTEEDWRRLEKALEEYFTHV